MTAAAPPLWQILIATIPHRHAKLAALLGQLDAWHRPGLRVLVHRDNLEAGTGAKRQALLEAATAEYTCFADDDDGLFPGYVPEILAALCDKPDYVGFAVLCTENGTDPLIAEHSVRYPGWHTWPEKMIRDISHLNPVRREIALLARFGDGCWAEDKTWADGIRASGAIRDETYIPQLLYRYQHDPDDDAKTEREPWTGPLPDLPAYPWLDVLP